MCRTAPAAKSIQQEGHEARRNSPIHRHPRAVPGVIHAYTTLHRRPPAETDFQAFFRVTPPSVHRMIVTLHERGLIERVPGQPRSITLRVPPDALPPLQSIKTLRRGTRVAGGA